MQFTKEEERVQQEACEYIEKKKEALIEEFITSKRPIAIDFVSIFMAGSPGAGKTEFSKRYIPLTFNKSDTSVQRLFSHLKLDINEYDSLMVRIDVDEVRSFIPLYQKTNLQDGTKGNAHVIQKAANKGLDILRSYCFENKISFLHDGTFGNYMTMKKLVKKSLKSGRSVKIYYLYLDPLKAWEFTKAREYTEGRNILKEKFIEQFFASKENVEIIKKEFGDDVEIDVIVKNRDNNVIDPRFNCL